MVKENELLERKEERQKCYERIDVLDKVGTLLLIGETDFATTQQVADYYGVGIEAIRTISTRNKEELKENGLITKYGSVLLKEIGVVQNDESQITKVNGGFVFEGTKINYSYNTLFPKRAILNVGMLLRDSKVAKELRSKLLDIIHDASDKDKFEENTITEDIIVETFTEKELNCKFIRVNDSNTDEYNIGFVLKNIMNFIHK